MAHLVKVLNATPDSLQDGLLTSTNDMQLVVGRLVIQLKNLSLVENGGYRGIHIHQNK